MTNLTRRRLDAMMTALTSMIAGYDPDQQGDAGDIAIDDLETAADWVGEQLGKREASRAAQYQAALKKIGGG